MGSRLRVFFGCDPGYDTAGTGGKPFSFGDIFVCGLNVRTLSETEGADDLPFVIITDIADPYPDAAAEQFGRGPVGGGPLAGVLGLCHVVTGTGADLIHAFEILFS